MPRALRTRVFVLAAVALFVLPPPVSAQISAGGALTLPGWIQRNNVAYDSVNQVYLVITDRPPVRGQFVNKNGVAIGGEFQISLEPGDPYLGWVSIAFGGPTNDPTFLVTYIVADDVLNPKYARFVRYNGGAPTVSGAIHIANVTTEWFAGEKAQHFWNGQHWVIGTRVMPAGWTMGSPQVNTLAMNGNLSPPVVLGDGLDLYGSPALSCAANGVCIAMGFMAGIPTGYSGGTYARRFDGTTLSPLGDLFFLASGLPNEDQGVVYQAHTGKFLAQWYRGPSPGYIDTRIIGTDGSLSPLDFSRGIGPNAGTNAIAYNTATSTTLLVTKWTNTALVAMELGDDGYPKNSNNIVLVTNWDGSTPDYWPSIGVNNADRQWLVTATLSAGMTGRIITGVVETNLVTNGTFAGGLSSWSTFGQPTSGDFVASVTGGVLSFYRQPLPPGTTGQGVVFQRFNVGLAAGTTLTARFDLANSSTMRKRITVLLHDDDFSDLQMCTFWLAAGSPMRQYLINTHVNQAWDNARISFYAGSTGSDGGAYLLDNVSVFTTVGPPADRTECVDPTTPGPQSFPDSNNMLVNGNFTAGMTPWTVFGQITHRIQGGVFEFVRPAGTPAGVVLQPTGVGLPLHARMTLTLRLGNSSGVRKRVTVLVHDIDFSDLSACTFWLAPGQALGTHTVKLFANKAWTGTTVSVYPSAVDTAQWIRMDDASLKVTLSAPLTGTECIDPAGGGGETVPGFSASPETRRTRVRVTEADRQEGAPTVWTAEATETGAQMFVLGAPIDLTDAAAPVLRFDSRLSGGASEAFVEVTRDGVTWSRVAAVPPSDDWVNVGVDLSDFAGAVVYVRFVYAGVGPIGGAPAEAWAIRDISVDRAPGTPRTRAPRR